LIPKPRIDEKTAAKLAEQQRRRKEAEAESPFSVMVGQVYDGPLDLLLDLIRKQDIDVYDIPIAKITAQFLAYVNQLKASDVDVAGEFIYTASLLIHIKSKMLLPRTAEAPGEAAEDPRRELVERLLEHERFKNAAQMLQQKQMMEAASWSNPGRGAGDRSRHGRPGEGVPGDFGARAEPAGAGRGGRYGDGGADDSVPGTPADDGRQADCAKEAAEPHAIGAGADCDVSGAAGAGAAAGCALAARQSIQRDLYQEARCF
jgi:hypothetical protein